MTERQADYVLGTHDDEIARLALQHRVWRSRALDAWCSAGFTIGQTVLDIGCGPGHASLDLAEIVGPSGRIVAFERARRFLDTLEAARLQRALDNIVAIELDLDQAELPVADADGAWCRWVFAFLKRPREVLARVARALKPLGVLVIHEYFDYRTWRVAPRSQDIEDFVAVVMESWRASGGEPDIGLTLPAWLHELGFTMTLKPIIEVVPVSSFVWQWPRSFIQINLRRQVELGYLTSERAAAIWEAFARSEGAPHTLMITPAVLEIIAVRRDTTPSATASKPD